MYTAWLTYAPPPSQDVELEATPSFSIVNPRTAASCILVSVITHTRTHTYSCTHTHTHIVQGLLFSHVDQVLVGVDWLVGRLKVEAATPAEDNFGEQCIQCHVRPTCLTGHHSTCSCTPYATHMLMYMHTNCIMQGDSVHK